MNEAEQTIFIVDDDVSFLETMSRWLKAYGYRVKKFNSASDFLGQGLQSQATGCVITDLQMPDMDGMEFQIALAQSANPLPIIFLTSYGDVSTSVHAMRSGAEDFLQKTASKEDLLAAIKRALARNVDESFERLRQRELRLALSKLTLREKEVLMHVMNGKLNKQISADLGIDERSVKRHRSHLMAKLGVTSVVELTQLVDEAKYHNVITRLDY